MVVYGSLVRGCSGVVHGDWRPGTGYSTENGMAVAGMQVAELLPALTNTAGSPRVSAPSGVLARAFTEADGTLSVVAVNTHPQAALASRIACSAFALGATVFTPFHANNTVPLSRGSDGTLGVTQLLQPYEVQVFRSGYTPPPTPPDCTDFRVYPSVCTLVRDPGFEQVSSP